MNSSELNPDEGSITIRFVLGRDDDPAAYPYIVRTETLDSHLPPGITPEHIGYMFDEFYDEPHYLVEDIDKAFKAISL